MTQSLYLDSVNGIVNDAKTIFQNPISITDRNTLPADWNYKMNSWYKIKDIVSIFVDIRWSTKLSATLHEKSTASIYELFTGTAIKIFHEMWAEYIDVKWDGVFALFSANKIYTALSSAITFKTFAQRTFKVLIDKKFEWKNIDIWFHMWIDQKTVLVKQIWLKDSDRRDRRKNEVWAWKPVNMSAKLASLSNDWELIVSDRFFKNLWKEELILKSCWCCNEKETGEKVDLWEEVDLSQNDKFDFDKAYMLKSMWCSTHWKEWCQKIIQLDNK